MKKHLTLLLFLFICIGTSSVQAQVKMPIAKETRKITFEGSAKSELGSRKHNVNKLVGWMNLKGLEVGAMRIKEKDDHTEISAKFWMTAYYILKTSVDPRMEESKIKGNYDYFKNRGEAYGQIRFDITYKIYDDRVEYIATNFDHYYPNRMSQTCGPLEASMGKNTTKDYWLGYKLQTVSYMNWWEKEGLAGLLKIGV